MSRFVPFPKKPYQILLISNISVGENDYGGKWLIEVRTIRYIVVLPKEAEGGGWGGEKNTLTDTNVQTACRLL